MLRLFLPLTLAATLLAPLAVSADTPATPTTPAAPTAPATPPAHHNRAGGKITAVDATKKTVTVTRRKVDTTITIADDAKIYKIGDAKGSPTGTFADLTVGAFINAHTNGDATAPTANEVHLVVPKTKGTPPATTPPTPATP